MIKDRVTGERFNSIKFKDYCFAHRHIGRHKDFLEVSLWKDQDLRTTLCVECASTKQDYIAACKTIWKDLKRKF